jgi:rare lipoprotein A
MQERRMTRLATAAALIAIAAVAPGCAKKKTVAGIPPPPAVEQPARAAKQPPPAERIGDVETGLASWYGYPYHGRRAANGEIYDMEKLTAAHRTLAFETWVEVQNLDNGKIVTVRITDRGPFVDGRVIDLSKAAARSIEMLGPGLANVRLKIVSAPPDAAVAMFAVQVGAFQDHERAERVRSEFERTFGTTRVVRRSGNPVLWRVLVGSEPTEDAAAALAVKIRTPGQPAFVVRLDDAANTPATLD